MISLPLLLFPIITIGFLLTNKQIKGIHWFFNRNQLIFWAITFIGLWMIRQYRILSGDFDLYYSSFFGFFVVVFGIGFYKLLLTFLKDDNDRFED